MKKLFKKEELQKKAQEIFVKNEQADVLFATTDGQFFLKSKEICAKHHARVNKLNVIEIERSEDVANNWNTHQDALAAIPEMSKEELEAHTDTKWKSVNKAAKVRLEELAKAE